MDKEDPYQYRLENHKVLRFGTSGLRDYDDKLTDLQIYISTKGFLNYLFLNNMIEKGGRIALAGDYRPSTSRILTAVAMGILDSGFLVDYCGKIPTPAVSLWGFSNKIPTIMVTASHNPYGQNGVKFISPVGEVLKHEEGQILDEISKVREEEYRKSWDESIFTKEGFLKKSNELYSFSHLCYYLVNRSLENINENARNFYIERYKKAFGKILSGVRVVFYEQTAVGRDIIPDILSDLGAVVIRVGRVDETKEFVPVDTEDMKPIILERMANFAYENNCDICITADGDSDRPAVLYLKRGEDGKFLYKNGKLDYKFIKGDMLNILVSLLIKPDFVAVPIHVNNKAYNVLIKNGINVKITKVGSAHVIKAFLDKSKENLDLKMYGFEANGGGILYSPITVLGVFEIGPLPTRDPLFPIICALIFTKIKNLSLEELYKEIFSGENFSHTHSGLVENLPGISVTQGLERYNSEVGKKIVEKLKPLHENISEIDFEEVKLFFINEENKVDEKVVEHLIKIRNFLHPHICEIIGEEIKIKKINFLDGVKVYLSNDEVVHLRPSGATAQFRIYIESPDEERAMKLVEKAVSPSGGLVKFINDFIDGKIEV